MATEAIKRLRYIFSSEGADKVASDANKVGAAVTASATTQTRLALDQEKSFANLERRYVTTIRAQQDYEKVQRQVNAAVAQHPELAARANTVLAAAALQYGQAGNSAHAANENFADTRVKFRALAEAASQAGGPLGNIIQQTGLLTIGSQHLSAGIIASTVAVGAFVAGLVKLVEIEKQAAAIGNTAQLANVGGQQLQGLISAAGFKGTGSDVLLASMTKFNEQVDQAKSGLGSLGALFRANGVSADSTAEAFFKVADLVKNAKSEAEKFSIVRQAGLPAENQMILLLSQGGDAIRRQADEARKLTDVQLEQARILEERWNELWMNFERFAKTAAVNVGTILSDVFDAIRGDFEKQKSTFAPAQITVGGTPAPTVDPERQRALLDLEKQHIALLGQTATVQDEIRAKEIEITLARMQGVKVTDDEKNKLLEIAELQAKATRSADVVAALGDSATAAEKYGAAVDALKVKFAENRLNQDQFARALQNIDPTVIALKKTFEDLTQGIVAGLLSRRPTAKAAAAAAAKNDEISPGHQQGLAAELVRTGEHRNVSRQLSRAA